MAADRSACVTSGRMEAAIRRAPLSKIVSGGKARRSLPSAEQCSLGKDHHPYAQSDAKSGGMGSIIVASVEDSNEDSNAECCDSASTAIVCSWFQASMSFSSCILLLTLLLVHNGCHGLSSSPSSTPPMSTDYVVVSQRSNGQCKTFSFDDATSIDERKRRKSMPTFQRVQTALRSTFFPTVTTDVLGDGRINDHQLRALSRSGYLKYIFCDNLQDLSTTLRWVLVTQRVLKRVGVGRSGATALAATLNFLVRDFCGILSSLLFTSLAANSFRRDVKRWKFLSAIMLDISLTLQNVASSMNGLFLPLMCLGSICQAMYNVAASPCTGVIKLHWALKLQGSGDGIAEISAKRRAQRTLMDLIGLLLAGIGSVRLDGIQSKGLRVCLYCGLTALHLVSSNRSLRLVELDWLNGWRLHRIVEEFLERSDIVHGLDTGAREGVQLSSPNEISNAEPLLFLPESRRGMHGCIRMGVSFDEIARLSHEPPSLQRSNLRQKQSSSRDKYILAAGHDSGAPLIAIAFFRDTTNRDTAKAYLHGCLHWRVLESLSKRSHLCWEVDEPRMMRKAEDIAARKLARLWPVFETCASGAGWKLDKTECSTEGYLVV
ncbi:hypothetical protein ACHAXT_002144 [Thalassiosira profunda]